MADARRALLDRLRRDLQRAVHLNHTVAVVDIADLGTLLADVDPDSHEDRFSEVSAT